MPQRRTGEPCLALAVRPDHHVLEQRHAGEQRQVLEGAGNAVPGDAVGRHAQQVVALEQHPAFRVGW